ncbi:hypothetical protein [Marinomonas sp. TW1]|uniref:hypothetical protein n=1 Tax=Marinomonas sp. TW1 TaxID=1561203 RepID=UPI0007AF83F1|nr:hypothetical protein [Marinomonas sp. TW1]
MLANIASDIGQVSESAMGRGSLDIGFDTESSEAFQAKDQDTFNDTNINAREVSLIEQGWGGEANFIEKYGTKNGEKTVDVELEDAAEQAIKTAIDSANAFVQVIQEDPIGLAEGLRDVAIDAVTHPLDTFVFEDSKGSAADRQLVAELQGNAETATKEAGSNLIDTVSEMMPPGVGKAAKGTTVVVAKEAVEQASKKVDFVDTDSEMIGQDAPTYDVVVHSSKTAEEVNQEMIDSGYKPAWTDGTDVENVTLMPGYKLEQMVEKDALQNIDADNPNSVMGRWASDDTLPLDQQEARDVTAVKVEWKEDPSIVEIEVTEPLNVNRGSTREMYDESIDRKLPGGATQVELIEGKENTSRKVKITNVKEMTSEGSGGPDGEVKADLPYGPATTNINSARLNTQKVSEEISGGHAFEKHVLTQGEFSGLGIRTQTQFQNHIENVLSNPSSVRYASDGRTYYLHESTGTVVVRDPKAPDGGTSFQPKD